MVAMPDDFTYHEHTKLAGNCVEPYKRACVDMTGGVRKLTNPDANDDDETDGNWRGSINDCDPLSRNTLYVNRSTGVLTKEHRQIRVQVANAIGSSRQWPRHIANMFNTCYTLQHQARFELVLFLWGNGIGADYINKLLQPLVKDKSTRTWTGSSRSSRLARITRRCTTPMSATR